MNQINGQAAEKRHSRLGIASVIIGFGLPILLILFIFALYFVRSSESPLLSKIEDDLIVAGLFFPVLHLIALILSFVGLFSKKTKKLFPVIGAILNFILMVTGIVLIVTGVSLVVLLLGFVNVPVR